MGRPPGILSGWTISTKDTSAIVWQVASGSGLKPPDHFETWGFETDGADQPGSYTYKVAMTFSDGKTDNVDVPGTRWWAPARRPRNHGSRVDSHDDGGARPAPRPPSHRQRPPLKAKKTSSKATVALILGAAALVVSLVAPRHGHVPPPHRRTPAPPGSSPARRIGEMTTTAVAPQPGSVAVQVGGGGGRRRRGCGLLLLRPVLVEHLFKHPAAVLGPCCSWPSTSAVGKKGVSRGRHHSLQYRLFGSVRSGIPDLNGPKSRLRRVVALAVGVGALTPRGGWWEVGTIADDGDRGVALLGNTLAAVAEEAFFKAFPLPAVEPGTAREVFIGTAALFAAKHVTVYGTWVLPIDLAAGFILSWQRWATGSWAVPAITHVVANVLVVR